MQKEYNELTKVLLAAGYHAENYPKDMVQLPSHSSFCSENPLDNFYGGFEYKRAYSNTLIFRTGCGKFVMGNHVLSDMSYQGKNWTLENFSPVLRCPYDKPDCPDNDPLLHGMSGGGLCVQCWCACHPTELSYDYDNSIEKADRDRQDEKERAYQEYAAKHNDRVCRNHMYYDERTREWNLRYDPGDCALLRCKGFCPVLGKELDHKKGNVYYDIKITKQRTDLNGTLFEGQIDTTITKGIRNFKHPVSMDICRNYVKLCKEDLIRNVLLNKYHAEIFFAKHYGHQFDVEIINIRAEQKESRDLIQDLEDIKNGIRVSHASDTEKMQKTRKAEHKAKARQDKIKRLEKKLLQAGYYNLEPYSIDRIHADKWLGEPRIAELEALRLKRLEEAQLAPQQLTMTDYLPIEDTN